MSRRNVARRAVTMVVAAAVVMGLTLVGPRVARAQAGGAAGEGGSAGATTPRSMVETYQTLADAILAVKKTETNLVKAILGAAYAHAQVELGRARQAVRTNDTKGSQAALENLAADVAQIASEGDAAVGAVRKRLLEGGHHHHADAEAKGIYDPGFVVVTRAARQSLLEVSRALGQLARAPKADALEAEWKKVQATWADLEKASD